MTEPKHTPGEVGLLSPCPFCGGEELDYNTSADNESHAVCCPSCGIVGPTGQNFQDALEEWNRRNSAPEMAAKIQAQAKQIERLREGLEQAERNLDYSDGGVNKALAVIHTALAETEKEATDARTV